MQKLLQKSYQKRHIQVYDQFWYEKKKIKYWNIFLILFFFSNIIVFKNMSAMSRVRLIHSNNRQFSIKTNGDKVAATKN